MRDGVAPTQGAAPSTPVPLRSDDGRIVSVLHIVAELAEKGRQARAFQADVTDGPRAEQIVEELLADWGQLDVLVHQLQATSTSL